MVSLYVSVVCKGYFYYKVVVLMWILIGRGLVLFFLFFLISGIFFSKLLSFKNMSFFKIVVLKEKDRKVIKMSVNSEMVLIVL